MVCVCVCPRTHWTFHCIRTHFEQTTERECIVDDGNSEFCACNCSLQLQIAEKKKSLSAIVVVADAALVLVLVSVSTAHRPHTHTRVARTFDYLLFSFIYLLSLLTTTRTTTTTSHSVQLNCIEAAAAARYRGVHHSIRFPISFHFRRRISHLGIRAHFNSNNFNSLKIVNANGMNHWNVVTDLFRYSCVCVRCRRCFWLRCRGMGRMKKVVQTCAMVHFPLFNVWRLTGFLFCIFFYRLRFACTSAEYAVWRRGGFENYVANRECRLHLIFIAPGEETIMLFLWVICQWGKFISRNIHTLLNCMWIVISMQLHRNSTQPAAAAGRQ